MQRTTIDFGIDLGTTNSTIAVIDDTGARVIFNKGGSGITSSAVWMDKRGNIHVGHEAKLRALMEDPDNADVEFKLRMGLNEKGQKVFNRSGMEMWPEELSAEVLKSLKTDVQINMGEVLRTAVVTVPAAFELPQTNATRRACCGTSARELELGIKKIDGAGFEQCILLLEPVAASLAYGFQTERENVYWLVYDFGGGTFDAAVMRVRDGLIQVVNHDGDNHLGGKLIDWDIVTKRLLPALARQLDLPDFHRNNPRWKGAFGKMKYHAELAKIEVCRTRAPFEIWIEKLCEDGEGKDVDFSYLLTPEDVKEISRPYIERSLNLCRKTLEDKRLSGDNLERILMVGGTTLNPWVREAVAAELGAKLEFSIDPVTVVARGAAIFASTQKLSIPVDESKDLSQGTWKIQIEHEPVDNTPEPDVGGRIIAPQGESPERHTIEFIDSKTQWRSGRITLGTDGIFMTQLYAEEKRRCRYAIELCDPTGTLIPTQPDSVVYTIGVKPDDPPASHSYGIGLASDEMCTYIKKGSKLKFDGTRGGHDHHTTVSLRAGNAGDKICIPVLEGEHSRATRNHYIGELIIDGSQVKRDLPAGSQLEITMIMYPSQEVRVQVFVPILDEDFEANFDMRMKNDSLEELHREVEEQKKRYADARQQTEQTGALKGQAALARIESDQLINQVDDLMESAQHDPDALQQLDRRLRDLTAAVDEVEDSVEWPLLLERAEGSKSDTQAVVNEYGSSSDKSRLGALMKELQGAIDSGDPDLLRGKIADLDGLWFEVLERQPGWHVGRFNHLKELIPTMQNSGQAEQLVMQGNRAINNNDIDALKAVNRQLRSLLPQVEQAKVDRRVGTLY
ncbi:MAG: Hsp70 family protein [Syntrophotaleaceae bacterium]